MTALSTTDPAFTLYMFMNKALLNFSCTDISSANFSCHSMNTLYFNIILFQGKGLILVFWAPSLPQTTLKNKQQQAELLMTMK